MKDLFQDIIKMENVMGLMVFSFKGETLYKDFNITLRNEPDKVEWWPLFIGFRRRVSGFLLLTAEPQNISAGGGQYNEERNR